MSLNCYCFIFDKRFGVYLMNRLIALLLIILYLPFSADATVTVHYCMGKRTGINVSAYAPDNKTCSNCGMVKANRKGCCNDKQETIRLNKDQLPSSVNNILAPSACQLQNIYSSVAYLFINPYTLLFHSAHSPPSPNVSRLFLHCVFLI